MQVDGRNLRDDSISDADSGSTNVVFKTNSRLDLKNNENGSQKILEEGEIDSSTENEGDKLTARLRFLSENTDDTIENKQEDSEDGWEPVQITIPNQKTASNSANIQISSKSNQLEIDTLERTENENQASSYLNSIEDEGKDSDSSTENNKRKYTLDSSSSDEDDKCDSRKRIWK